MISSSARFHTSRSVASALAFRLLFSDTMTTDADVEALCDRVFFDGESCGVVGAVGGAPEPGLLGPAVLTWELRPGVEGKPSTPSHRE
jgi:hypothetical protein